MLGPDPHKSPVEIKLPSGKIENDYSEIRVNASGRRFLCTVCKKRFIQKMHLQRHHSDVHDNKRKFPCTLCPRVFKQKVHLEKHILFVDHSKKRFHCIVCTKTFKRKKDLQVHLSAVNDADNCLISKCWNSQVLGSLTVKIDNLLLKDYVFFSTYV